VNPGLPKDADNFPVLLQTCAAGPSEPLGDNPTSTTATGGADYQEYLFTQEQPGPQAVSSEYISSPVASGAQAMDNTDKALVSL
jgi:hypothetical protein